MGITEPLYSAHRDRLAGLDALLPPAPPPADGEHLDAATADGTKVTGILQRRLHGPDDVARLWSAAEVWQLFPYFGDTGTEGADLLLRALRSRLDGEAVDADSACVVTWPSRDAEAIRALLDHGLVPLSALAVRTAAPGPVPESDAVVRRARPDDFDVALELATATFAYTGLVAATRRPNTGELLAPALRRALAEDEPPVWLAERDGEVRAVAECAWVEAGPGTGAGELLPAGRWGYVNNVVTAPGERGGGLGQALMAHVHREFAAGGARTYLYYNPTNPLSSVFWHRQGYRPLWTTWEIRPASALR